MYDEQPSSPDLEATQDLPSPKRVVHFCDCRYDCITIGKSAWLVPIDHPQAELNGYWVQTSDVVSYNALRGRIETLNTVYQHIE